MLSVSQQYLLSKSISQTRLVRPIKYLFTIFFKTNSMKISLPSDIFFTFLQPPFIAFCTCCRITTSPSQCVVLSSCHLFANYCVCISRDIMLASYKQWFVPAAFGEVIQKLTASYDDQFHFGSGGFQSHLFCW